MARYETEISWTEQQKAHLVFEVPDNMTPEEVLNESLPPLENLKVEEIKLVAAGESTVN